ncbi:Methyltransferase type 11 [Nitrospira japonica]|uniref:Arsenite methyltransferase n=1 Tax=Nitrospira japonica TaxID=1325564 RepID=A0A1W1I7L9_9BACT|nr:arsenite methyltransferase [Nitrospira japonica]SLM48859.1 Methyltransferase type 11 [Nitrospira japonica]
MNRPADIKAHVRDEYGQAARQAQSDKPSCCGTGHVLQGDALDPITGNLYGAEETAELPAEALRASFGCGNPTVLASIQPGETVLDLGSGGGIDVLLSARRVGPTGKVYGLDMTDEMLVLARENQRKVGMTNVEFLKGDIEQIPLPDQSVDLILSNCVINLAPDKDRVATEAFRVLKPGGRLAVSDIVIRGEMPVEIRHSVELWAGCVAGALEESVYRETLRRAGFEQITIEPTRVYSAADARGFLLGAGLDVETVAHSIDGKFMSGFVRAIKPASAKTCCGPSCCA